MAAGTADNNFIRLEKWLWQARFFKTRALATKLCASGRVRVNGAVVRKAHYAIRAGLVLTFPQARKIRVVRVLALGDRRGPAPEASALYEVLIDDHDHLPARGRS
jgi:ribosome-associated heat shock protein Hsp15